MGEDEVGCESFTWVRNTKVGNSMVPQWASLLRVNAKVEQYGSKVRFSIALTKQGRR